MCHEAADVATRKTTFVFTSWVALDVLASEHQQHEDEVMQAKARALEQKHMRNLREIDGAGRRMARIAFN